MQWKVELDSSSSLSFPLHHPRAASPIHIEAVVTIFLFFLLHWLSVEIMGITVLFTYFISNLAATFCHLYFLPSYIYFLMFFCGECKAPTDKILTWIALFFSSNIEV